MPARPGSDDLGKVVVMGAGAVGCYYGGLLARAGHDVTLIGRPDHVRAIRRDGLRLETDRSDEFVRIGAATGPSAASGASLLLLCVKSTDTERAAVELASSIDSTVLIVTMQNGVDNDARVRACLPNDVAAAVVYVAAEMAGPGHVRHHGGGRLLLGRSERSAALARAFVDAAIPTEVIDDIASALWEKLIYNCAYNALSAIARVPYGPLVSGAGIVESMDAIVDECIAVAAKDGISIRSGLPAQIRGLAAIMPNQYSSTAQDLMRGRPSEIDHLNGYVVARGAALGVATPLNRLLHALVKTIEVRVDAERQ